MDAQGLVWVGFRKGGLPTISEHLRCPLQRCIAGEAGRRRGEQQKGHVHWISGIRGCGVPGRYGRSFGSGMCPGLREYERFPLAPRCPRLAWLGPHLAQTSQFTSWRGERAGHNLEEVVSQELVWSPPSSPVPRRVVSLFSPQSKGNHQMPSLCLGDNKGWKRCWSYRSRLPCSSRMPPCPQIL